jgi:hypothetical protein
MDQCRLWKRLPPIIQHRHHPIKLVKALGLSEFLPMSLILSRLRAVPLTPRRGDYFEISTGLYVRKGPARLGSIFAGISLTRCWWMFRVWPCWWNRVDKRWSVVAIRRSFSESTANSNDRCCSTSRDGGLVPHGNSERRESWNRYRSPLSRTANCIAS